MPLELLTDLEWPDTIFRNNTPARSAMFGTTCKLEPSQSLYWGRGGVMFVSRGTDHLIHAPLITTGDLITCSYI